MYKITSKKARKLKEKDRKKKWNSKWTNFERDWKKNLVKKKILERIQIKETKNYPNG